MEASAKDEKQDKDLSKEQTNRQAKYDVTATKESYEEEVKKKKPRRKWKT